MGRDPLVSVCVPSYNHGQFISMTIESVLAQTYHNVEVVIVDDGSSDNTLAVLERYATRYPSKVRVFTHPGGVHRGISASANLAFQKAEGEYWCGLSSDDLFYPDKVEQQVEFLKRNPHVAFVYGYAHAISGHDLRPSGLLGVDISTTPNPLAPRLRRTAFSARLLWPDGNVSIS